VPARFRKLDERVVWTGTLVSAGTGTFVDPDGTTFERDIVHHPGAVVVVPVTDGGEVISDSGRIRDWARDHPATPDQAASSA